MHSLKRPLCAAMALAFSYGAWGQGSESDIGAEPTPLLDEVVVHGERERTLSGGETVAPARLQAMRATTSDTASLLREVPGVSLSTAGAVSSLPAIHGLADDRLRIQVDGMDLIASCPNHMNPPLSYLDPTAVGEIRVYSGLTPVSVGGDSLGGTIVVDSRSPEFAAPGQGVLRRGELGSFYRSNGDARGANLAATLATERLSLSYTAATATAGNYRAAADFKDSTETGRSGHALDLSEVGSTAYETSNHTLALAMRGGDHLLEARLGYQHLPYQLYPNQRMDMLDNEQWRGSLRYVGQFDWGSLQAQAYHEAVDHYMDFGPDRKLEYGSLTGTSGTVWPVIGMPMYTKSRTDGLSLKAELDLAADDRLRLGAELQRYRLDDWWPPSPDCGVGECVGGMAPLTFLNINDGQRDRHGLHAEWEARWAPQWLTLLGARWEQVTTDAGPVQGYNTATTGMSAIGYLQSATAFNALARKRTDDNLDLTLLARYTPDPQRELEFGYARKTRSPNLYERYVWSRNAMALAMNNFVGDGNGYLGNPDLQPEVAHTLSLTGDWHAADRRTRFAITPYLSYVTDYIDAVQWNRSTNLPGVNPDDDFGVLKYMNQSARIYGVDVSAAMPLARTAIGRFGLEGLLSYTRGRNVETGDGLYNIMPLNARLTLNHQQGGWDNALELVAVAGKQEVSAVRNEYRTPGYSLVNLRASHSWKTVRVDFGVDNLFDKFYYLPQGGAYVGQGQTMSLFAAMGGPTWGIGVPGMGRSLYAGLNLKF